MSSYSIAASDKTNDIHVIPHCIHNLRIGSYCQMVVYGHIESSGGLLSRNNFNSIFESCAFNDFGQVTKAS